MKRSLMPIIAIALGVVTTIVSVAPASACWWGRDHHHWGDRP
ncbi:hypothetical protein [Hyphomicrobium sp.]|nr:hypothetical protein [Hyphomicrobium sp.]HVZ03828.1 hypothetical protein [Hyphomicrobium sp.]